MIQISMTEEQLIDGIKEDDKIAYERLFKLYYSDLCKFCFRYVRDEVVSEEVVQEVFINIWDRRHQLSINSSVKAYLYTAIRNRAFNYIKLQLPKEQNKVEIEHMALLEVDTSEEELSLMELHRQVSMAIDRLPKKCRTIFNLSKSAGMTYKEIAEELDISVKTVENQVGHALRRLRDELNPIWDKIMCLLVMFLV